MLVPTNVVYFKEGFVQRKSTKVAVNIARVLLAAAPFFWIISRVDLKELLSAISHTSWWTLPVLLANTLLLMLLQGIRWWLLLRAFLSDLRLGETLSYHFKSLFYSIVLPTSAAQDVVRAMLISRAHSYSIAWGAAWVGRLQGVIVLTIFALSGVLFVGKDILPKHLLPVLLLSILGAFALVLISFSKNITRPIRNIISPILPAKFSATLHNIRQGVYSYRSKKKAIAVTLILTIITQFFFIVNAGILIYGIANTFPIFSLLAFIPAIEIICLTLPLTPSGIGIREALSVIMFEFIGLSEEHLLIYVVLSSATILLKLIGAIPILYETFFRKRY